VYGADDFFAGGPEMNFFSKAVLVAATVLLGACAYRPGAISDPIQRKFQYFSYLNGDDIRQDCRRGMPARYRLVYNAVYGEQVRAYDLRHSATGSGAVLFAHVFGGGGNVSTFDPRDPTGPWRGEASNVRLDEAQYLKLIRAIEASGFGTPAPEGMILPSGAFYWIASACADGQFHFNAWLYPSERFDQIRFAQLLFAHDRTGVPVNPPRPISRAEQRLKPQTDNPTLDFELRVGRNGLAGHGTVF